MVLSQSNVISSDIEFTFVNSVIKVAFDNQSSVEFPDYDCWSIYKVALESKGFKFTDKNHKVLKIDIYECNPVVVESKDK